MVEKMDKDHDKKISKSEYLEFWMAETAEKIVDGKFVGGYADYLADALARQQLVKSILNGTFDARRVCEEFFKTQDADGNGFISKPEVIKVATMAFGQSAADAEGMWVSMMELMDKDHDGKISKKEYVDYWESQTEAKKGQDGLYPEGYRVYLLEKLAKLWHS